MRTIDEARARMDALNKLAQEKWRSSGLSDEQAEELQFEVLSAARVKKLADNFREAGALKLQYFTLEGKPSKFYRIRYLEAPPGFGASAEKPRRYDQAAGSVNEIYLPPLLNWAEIARDINRPVFITEGELKAACGCANGMATIGLGGVDMWRSIDRGVRWLRPLGDFQWARREVFIVFDSDARHNDNVAAAQMRLASALVDDGAVVRTINLPSGDEVDDNGVPKKQGLDDFLVAYGLDDFNELLEDADAYVASEALWKMNEEVLLVLSPPIIVERRGGDKISPNHFVHVTHADRMWIERVDDKVKKFKTAQRWLEWPHRKVVQKMVYEPGQERLYDISVGQQVWNLWSGLGVKPVAGDMSWWDAVLNEIVFKGAEKERRWFEQWLAYPLQNPGTKLFSAVLLWSTSQGVFKSFIGKMICAIYGDNAITLGPNDIHRPFNSWAANRQFVLGEEVVGRDRREDAAFFKNLITQKEVTVNAKYIPEYTVADHLNYMFTSNYSDAFFLEFDDRRFFVHEIDAHRTSIPRSLTDQWDELLANRSGPQRLLHYLLQLDLSGFSPTADAMWTDSKDAMIRDGQSDVAGWCRRLMDSPDEMLRTAGLPVECDIFAPEQLVSVYDPEGKHRVSAAGLGRALRAANARAIGKTTVHISSKCKKRLYAIRNFKKWANVPETEAAKHWLQFFGAGPAPKKY